MTITDLDKKGQDFDAVNDALKERVVLCAGTGCVAQGALKIRDAIAAKIEEAGVNAEIVLEKHVNEKTDMDPAGTIYVSKSGCQGFCQMGPLVRVEKADILYCKVTEDDAADIVDGLMKDEVVDRLLYKDPATGEKQKGQDDVKFYSAQQRIVLRNALIDPEDINEYIAKDGYKAAKKVFTEMTSEEVCQNMIDSGLRGRGGGGFPTGLKWKFTLPYKNETKYVICNGDEGDPGAFMDRSVMEGNPHSVIEGMMIAAKSIEGTEGYVYVRAEYPLAVKRMEKAVKDAEAAGILGDNIFGTGKGFKITVMEGAGAFVCGEETALIASIEGKRGEPVPKPPFPAEKGLWGKPTTINNVETLSAVPYIILNGAENFKKVGTESSPGTKTFALTGHVANTGLIEVPFGTTLREIVYDIGGGIIDKDGKLTGGEYKAVQIGGPSGGCLTPEMADRPLDFDSLKEVGAMVGSGGLVVMNDTTCMVDVAKFFLSFTLHESCGKCTPCRVGNKRLHEMLTDITEGRGTLETLDKLEDLAHNIKKTSLCGLGQTSPNPVLSTLKYFREEYEAHVVDGSCPAGVCEKLTKYVINDACIGCTLCARKCPVDCIDGAKKEVHHIRQDECIKCGACFDACNFNAIYKM